MPFLLNDFMNISLVMNYSSGAWLTVFHHMNVPLMGNPSPEVGQSSLCQCLSLL